MSHVSAAEGNRPFVIGVAGGSGSGKTTVVDLLRTSRFGDGLSVLPHDAYYLNREHMPDAVRDLENWDHPAALDHGLYLQHLDELLAGRAVEAPVYDFAEHRRSEQTRPVLPRRVLVLEGILLFAVPEICERIDLRVFVETPADLRVVRRTVRDLRERGRTLEFAMRQYETTVRPMHQQFVEPSRQQAHLIIPWIAHNPPAVELLLARIAQVLGG